MLGWLLRREAIKSRFQVVFTCLHQRQNLLWHQLVTQNHIQKIARDPFSVICVCITIETNILVDTNPN